VAIKAFTIWSAEGCENEIMKSLEETIPDVFFLTKESFEAYNPKFTNLTCRYAIEVKIVERHPPVQLELVLNE